MSPGASYLLADMLQQCLAGHESSYVVISDNLEPISFANDTLAGAGLSEHVPKPPSDCESEAGDAEDIQWFGKLVLRQLMHVFGKASYGLVRPGRRLPAAPDEVAWKEKCWWHAVRSQICCQALWSWRKTEVPAAQADPET